MIPTASRRVEQWEIAALQPLEFHKSAQFEIVKSEYFQVEIDTVSYANRRVSSTSLHGVTLPCPCRVCCRAPTAWFAPPAVKAMPLRGRCLDCRRPCRTAKGAPVAAFAARRVVNLVAAELSHPDCRGLLILIDALHWLGQR